MDDTESTKRRRRLMIACFSVAVLLFVLTGISFPVIHSYIKKEITKKVVLKNGSETYDTWQEPKMPVYMQFYVFDLQNPVNVTMGDKPSVKQRGPYTYLEHRVKVDIVHNDNGTVTYRQIKSYHFVEHLSCGSDEQQITTANIPLVTLANWLKYKSSLDKKLANWIRFLAGDLFIKKTVRQIIFGYPDSLLALGMLFDPSRFYTDIAGIFAGKNDTDDGVYTIYTGESDITKLGLIDRYNGSSKLSFWTSDMANMLNGSDGTLTAPFPEKDKPLYMFSSDICRSVYGVYSGDTVTSQGIMLHRYRGNKDVVASAAENPGNAGFCTPAGHCMDSGVMNLTVCQQLDHFQIPIIASFPHFYLADPKFVEAIDGMHPDPALHTTDVDVEPNTGIVMKIAKRLQINIHIENMTFFKPLMNVQTMVYPVLWLNESVEIDDEHAHRLQHELLSPLRVVAISQYVAFSLAALLLCVALAVFIYDKRKKNDLTYSVNDAGLGDDEPLVS